MLYRLKALEHLYTRPRSTSPGQRFSRTPVSPARALPEASTSSSFARSKRQARAARRDADTLARFLCRICPEPQFRDIIAL